MKYTNKKTFTLLAKQRVTQTSTLPGRAGGLRKTYKKVIIWANLDGWMETEPSFRDCYAQSKNISIFPNCEKK